MKEYKKTLKTVVFSIGLSTMLLSTTSLSAQINRGLLDNPYKAQDGQGALRKGGEGQTRSSGSGSGSFINEAFGDTDTTSPVGGGLAILLSAGLGYAALKRKKED